ELHLALSQPQAALKITDALIESAPDGVAPNVWHARGEALLHLGRQSEAVEVLDAARAAAQAEQGLGRLWRIEASLARALRGLGRQRLFQAGLYLKVPDRRLGRRGTAVRPQRRRGSFAALRMTFPLKRR